AGSAGRASNGAPRSRSARTRSATVAPGTSSTSSSEVPRRSRYAAKKSVRTGRVMVNPEKSAEDPHEGPPAAVSVPAPPAGMRPGGYRGPSARAARARAVVPAREPLAVRSAVARTAMGAPLPDRADPLSDLPAQLMELEHLRG